MVPAKLKAGDTIGLICPCHYAERGQYAGFIKGIEEMGFAVKEGENLYKRTCGYAAGEQERADDFNRMAADDTVKMILFGGGNVGNEMLPYLDYEAVKAHPKIICSYSNGTTILNAVYAQTGAVTYYGQFPGCFDRMTDYNREQFRIHFMEPSAGVFQKSGAWVTLRGGSCEGTLIGGYTAAMALLMGNRYFHYEEGRDYLLFLEDHERFNPPAVVAAHLAYLEQSDFIRQVKGLIFGHYSETAAPELHDVLRRFGDRQRIPCIKCDDFGHGVSHAIFPIGGRARLDADQQLLEFLG